MSNNAYTELYFIANRELDGLQAQLNIGIEALEELAQESLSTPGGGCFINPACHRARKALKKIKALQKKQIKQRNQNEV